MGRNQRVGVILRDVKFIAVHIISTVFPPGPVFFDSDPDLSEKSGLGPVFPDSDQRIKPFPLF